MTRSKRGAPARLCVAAAALFPISVAIARGDQTVQVGPGLVFSPATVSVAQGEAVIWSFVDPLMSHSTTSDATTGPEVWDSGERSSGTFSHTFNTPGTYEYYCFVHSSAGGTLMNGVVEVLGGATPTVTSPPATATATPTRTATFPPATATRTVTLTPIVSGPTPTATTTSAVPTATATVAPLATTTPIGTPSGGVPTTTPSTEAAGIPALDLRGRALTAIALAAAGVAALFLARRR